MIGLVNRIAIVVFPRQPFADWANAVSEGRVATTVESLRECPSIYLVSDDPDLCTGDEMVKYYMQPIFEGWLDSWDEDESKWPKERTWEVFREWFEWLEVPQVADLERDELKVYPLESDDREFSKFLGMEPPSK